MPSGYAFGGPGCSGAPAKQSLPRPHAMDDSALPARLRHRNGLWVQGRPTRVRVYTLAGELIALWKLPTPALACSLCGRAAGLCKVSPSRCTFVLLGERGSKTTIGHMSKETLIWWGGFEPMISVQLLLAPYEGPPHEYGCRDIRNWRRFAAALAGYELSSVIMVDSELQANGLTQAPAGFALAVGSRAMI